ncbi:hypothetical protein OQA88_8 [Cercophora sp. LCS_1]
MPSPSEPPVITAFINTVLPNVGGLLALSAAVQLALDAAPGILTKETPPILDAESFITWMTAFLQWVPVETTNATQVLQKICAFYFILDQVPLLLSQTPISPNSVGNSLTILSSWIVEYAQAVGAFMDTPDSLTLESFQTLNDSKLYRVWESESPDGSGYSSFNEFFSRKLAKPRIVDSPGDNTVPVYPADSLFADAYSIDEGGNIWVPRGNTLFASAKHRQQQRGHTGGIRTINDFKGWTWSIGALLKGSLFASSFAGGVWVHSFLSTYNYHRIHSPVSGQVVDAGVIQNAAYLDVVATDYGDILPRHMKVMGTNLSMEVDAEDKTGYHFLQTRGYVVINSGQNGRGGVGLVAVLPIGMAQVSSIVLTVQPHDEVEKGDEIGYFQFGGSDVVTVFQANSMFSADHDGFNRETSVDEEGEPLPYTFYGSPLFKEASRKVGGRVGVDLG